ncbi:MAG TPA: hypothetical protein VN408_41535 [Actinoplanes sp.]|nr:hypothetical protein [Actinoplanes sp.]
MTHGTNMLRVFDASAVVEIFAGNRFLVEILDQMHAGFLVAALPVNAMAEAQAVLKARASHWAPVLAIFGLHTIPVTDDNALEIGMIASPRIEYHPVHKALIGPLMAVQVIHEAKVMNGVIVTSVPEAYRGHDVAILTIR